MAYVYCCRIRNHTNVTCSSSVLSQHSVDSVPAMPTTGSAIASMVDGRVKQSLRERDGLNGTGWKDCTKCNKNA